MIKNETQLRQAQERCEEIRQIIEDVAQQYSGTRRRIMESGFVEELAERREEIREYRRLRKLDLGAAIRGPLSEKPMLLDNINEFLTKLRIAADLTQEEIAERLGWHQPNVSRFESENYGGQTISKVVEYADGLGIWLYLAASLSGISPEITYRHGEEDSVVRNEERKNADVRTSIRRIDDTSASIATPRSRRYEESNEAGAWISEAQPVLDRVAA